MSVTREHRRFFLLLAVAGATALAFALAVGNSAQAGSDPEEEAELAAGEAAIEAGAPTEVSDDGDLTGSGCADNKACRWHLNDFGGQKVISDGSSFPGEWKITVKPNGDIFVARSAKNRFGDRKFMVRSEATGQDVCLDPGENRPSLPHPMIWRKVGQLGSRC